jgi:hypothetical protein
MSMGGNVDEDDGVTQGYGSISPLSVRNIFNKGRQVVPFTIKWQKYLDVNFTSNQNPFIVSYQTLSFWTGIWDSKSRNLQNAAALRNISTGTTFLHSELTLEVYAITRLRLLQQGTTNVTTYDFETSENLYMLLADRDLERYELVNVGSCGPLAQQIPMSTGFNRVQDSYTKIVQIPHKMKWSHTFSWPRLHHGYMWRIPTNLEDENAFNVLMPSAQGEENVSLANRITQQAEPKVSHPRLHIAQPQVPDEIGFMKFRYAVRMSAETHVLFHLLPDHIWGGSSRDFWERQCIELPITSGNPMNPDRVFRTVSPIRDS